MVTLTATPTLQILVPATMATQLQNHRLISSQYFSSTGTDPYNFRSVQHNHLGV